MSRSRPVGGSVSRVKSTRTPSWVELLVFFLLFFCQSNWFFIVFLWDFNPTLLVTWNIWNVTWNHLSLWLDDSQIQYVQVKPRFTEHRTKATPAFYVEWNDDKSHNRLLDMFLSCSFHVSSYSFGDMFLKVQSSSFHIHYVLLSAYSSWPSLGLRDVYQLCFMFWWCFVSEDHPPNFQTQRLQKMKCHLLHCTIKLFLSRKDGARGGLHQSTGLDGFGVQPVLFSTLLHHVGPTPGRFPKVKVGPSWWQGIPNHWAYHWTQTGKPEVISSVPWVFSLQSCFVIILSSCPCLIAKWSDATASFRALFCGAGGGFRTRWSLGSSSSLKCGTGGASKASAFRRMLGSSSAWKL